jgi:Ca2+-transporting ATPase
MVQGEAPMTAPLRVLRGGLTTTEAAARRRQDGPNALPEVPPVPAWRRLARQFASPLIAILVFALAIDLGLWLSHPDEGPPYEAAAIAAILILNAFLGFWQERKAERALDALRALSEPYSWAVRDGRLERVPTADLVRGDRVRLDAGDRVPADASVAAADDLLADEAVLTGESIPVAKRPGDEVFSGTVLVRGRGWATVIRTGPRSAMGRVAELLGAVTPEATPLQRRLDRFGRQVAVVVVMIAAVLVGAGLAIEGTARFAQYFLVAVALAVAAVPEGLPAAVSFALALGVERMARRHAVVRRMDAVEALGSVTVIATDKTGTLTENRMEVRAMHLTDEGRAIRAMVLANDADALTGVGDPLELALLAAARNAGILPEATQDAAPRTASRAFDSAWRFMRVTVSEAGGEASYLKGAPEILVERCRLAPAERVEWLRRAEEAGRTGHRAIALAWSPGDTETGLTWLGLVQLWDPPRPEAADAVARCRAAGIRVLMVTGDHPATAQAVADAVGLARGRLVTGDELARLSSGELRRAVDETAVFARVTAEQKLAIVSALQANNEIVAVTGDGVNDAPALKKANVGIAMGQRGSAVSREVADLVLLDDHFATIVAAIEEGRSIFANIRKFLRFLFSTNLSEVVVVSGGFIAALSLGLHESDGSLLLPLTAAQLLWINLVTDGAPALALSLDQNPGVMKEPPRPPSEPLLDRRSGQFILAVGLGKSAFAVLLLLVLPAIGRDVEATRTALFLFVASGQLLLAYPSRWIGAAQPRNRILLGAVVLTLLLQPLLLLVPWLRLAFDTVPVDGVILGAVASAAVAAWLLAMGIARHLWRPAT